MGYNFKKIYKSILKLSFAYFRTKNNIKIVIGKNYMYFVMLYDCKTEKFILLKYKSKYLDISFLKFICKTFKIINKYYIDGNYKIINIKQQK